jgi:broad specificity phosphatase PhoE
MATSLRHLILLRHPETRALAGLEPNTPRNDSALSPRGIAQAEQAAAHLAATTIDLILCSLFQRTQATAAILNQTRGVPVYASMALNEFFLRDDGSGVENIEQGLARSLGFVQQFSPYYGTIAVVGHSSILATLLMGIGNLPYTDWHGAFALPGTCITLRFDPDLGDTQWRVVDRWVPSDAAQ